MSIGPVASGPATEGSVAKNGHGRSGLAVTAAVLFGANLLYQLSYATLDIALPLIGRTLRASAPQLATIAAASSIGFALFALPAGAFSHRWGARTVLLAGIVLTGVAWFLSAYSASVLEMAVLRFLTGAGGALLYVTALGWLGRLYSSEQRGIIFGLFWSSGVALGGTLGFVSGAFLGSALGWRFELAWGGAATLVVAALAFALLRSPSPISSPSGSESTREATLGTLRARSVWGLSLGTVGIANAGNVSIVFLALFVVYAHPGWTLTVAAAAASSAFIATVPGGAFGGWLGERGPDRRLLVVGLSGIFGLLFLLIPYESPIPLCLEYAVLGFLFGGMVALLYAIPSHLPETRGVRLPIAVGAIETSQVILSAAYTVVFGLLIAASGFTTAWITSSLLVLVCLPALLAVTPNRARGPAASQTSRGNEA